VKSTHVETPTEHGENSIFQFTMVVGTIGDKVYSLESADNRLDCLKVGQDFPVVKLDKNHVEIEVPGKKRPINIRFEIKGVAEAQ
jgi:hypothetical protein